MADSDSKPTAKSKRKGTPRKPPAHAWKPGQSGNPGGRARVTDSIRRVRELALQKSPEALEILWQIAKDGDRDTARVAACREILDRGIGKPVQAVELSGPDGEPIKADLTSLTTEELLTLRLIAAKASK